MPEMTWHHAYNGLPAERDPRAASEAEEDRKARGFYGDGRMRGHDRFTTYSQSGEIEVEITVKSPTLPAHQIQEEPRKGLLVVPSLSGDPQGAQSWEDATIPVSSLKGMLSSAYEAVTMSRLRVFGDHSHVVTSRRTAEEATGLYPVFLRLDEDEGGNGEGKRRKWHVRVMLGDNDRPRVGLGNDGWRNPPKVACAAVFPDDLGSAVRFLNDGGACVYTGAAKEEDSEGDPHAASKRLETYRKRLPHGRRVTFEARREGFYRDHYRYVVRRIFDSAGGVLHVADSKTNDNDDDLKTFTGYVVRVATSHASSLVETKYNEFVFFNRPGQEIDIALEEQAGSCPAIDSLVEVLFDYLSNVRALALREHRSHATDGDRMAAQGRTSLSPNNRLVEELIDSLWGDMPRPDLHDVTIVRSDILDLLEKWAGSGIDGLGIPLFASIEKGRVTGLHPAQVGRRASRVSPGSLAEDAQVKPAGDGATMSPAERMWGYVAPARDDDSSQPAARGRIRISRVEPVTDRPDGARDPLQKGLWALPLVGGPKPSTGTPYIRLQQGTTGNYEALTRGQAYGAGQRLIRKVYPVHRVRLGDQALSRGVSLDGANNDVNDSQPRVGSYLAPGARFRTTIQYEGLAIGELCVLLWLLTPERLAPRSAAEKASGAMGLHRIGYGKPWGMGAIEVRAVSIVYARGDGIAQRYRKLTRCLGLPLGERPLTLEGEKGRNRADNLFDWLPDGFEENEAVRLFRRSCYGWDDFQRRRGGPDDNVSYPDEFRRVGDNEISPIITWFKNREKNRVDVWSGRREGGHGGNPVQLDPKYDLPGLEDMS